MPSLTLGRLLTIAYGYALQERGECYAVSHHNAIAIKAFAEERLLCSLCTADHERQECATPCNTHQHELRNELMIK